MMPRRIIVAGLTIGLAVAAAPVVAKEYNKRQHLAPEQGAKVVRTIAGARNHGAQHGAGQQGDMVNTGCGKLEIGNVKPDRYRRGRERDNVVVVTGDVINVARGCRNNR